MAKISELTTGTPTGSDEWFPAIQSGVLKKFALSVSGQGTYVPLDQSGWSDVNVSGLTVTQGSGVVQFSLASEDTESMHGRFTTAPATPYSVVTLIHIGFQGTSGLSYVGPALRESGTSKIVAIGYTGNAGGTAGPKIHCRKNTNATTNSSGTQTGAFLSPPGPVWLKVADNGTTVSCSYGLDGVNFIDLVSETRGTFFTTAPDQIGIVAQNFSSGVTVYGSVMSWLAS